MSRGHGHHANDEPAAETAAAEPAPAIEPAAPAAAKPLSLEERVARLEAYLPRLEAILGPVAPPSPDQPPAGG